MVIFCFYRCFILKVLEFHFPDIILSLLPLFYLLFPPFSRSNFSFTRQGRGIFLMLLSYFCSACNTAACLASHFFSICYENPCSNPSATPAPPPSTPTRPKCLRAICNLLNPAKIEIYVPLDKGYPAIMLCMCWYALASQVKTLAQ